MSDLPAESEILRENFAEEMRAKMQAGAIAAEALKAVMEEAFLAAYAKTFSDCVRITADTTNHCISVRIPNGLMPRHD